MAAFKRFGFSFRECRGPQNIVFEEALPEPWLRRMLLQLPITTAQFILDGFSVQVCDEAQNIAMPNGDRMGRYAAGPSSRKQFVRRGLTAKGAVKPSKSKFLSLIDANRNLLFDPAGFGPNSFLVPVRHSDLLRVRTDAIQRQSNHRKEPTMGLDTTPPKLSSNDVDSAINLIWSLVFGCMLKGNSKMADELMAAAGVISQLRGLVMKFRDAVHALEYAINCDDAQSWHDCYAHAVQLSHEAYLQAEALL